ncbi:hypothetical protein MSAN_01241900 [Mycena sanguinolenta]|uniref:Uncharacterized protein n=1 Tax=Mycena sanguinolenta TaxID=230812 RepID=A0A8H6YH49_9AGAR|nr:hypothetical protein MSAN_01241900 [Mycena sanguinolenta]
MSIVHRVMCEHRLSKVVDPEWLLHSSPRPRPGPPPSPYAPHHHTAHHHTVLQTANWGAPPSVGAQKPRLRLAVSLSVLTPGSGSSWDEKPRKFDPFADEPPVASTSQNTPPAPARGRALTPLSISTSAPAPTPTTPTVGRRRAPSFSAGSGTPLPPRVGGAAPLASLTKLTLASQRGYYSTASSSSSHHAHSTSAPSNYSPYSNAYSSSSHQYSYAPASGSLASAPSPPPSLTRSLPSSRAASPAPSASSSAVKSDAPTPFHARHYSTPDARARLLARTLLNRIHAVGRPRSCSSQLRASAQLSGSSKSKDGYENECGGRGYIPSRLSVCTMAA